MVSKPYQWKDGATLEEHSKRKHKILCEYFRQYILVRCQMPKQTKFRLAIVDGFAGAGRYNCGSRGSPIIFMEILAETLNEINLRKASEGLPTVEIECFLQLNDFDPQVVELLKANIAPIIAASKDTCPTLSLIVEYSSGKFEDLYSNFATRIQAGRFRNVIYNLDQCGHTHVERTTLDKIMKSEKSVEIFYTYAIQALITYLDKSDPQAVQRKYQHLHIDPDQFNFLDEKLGNQEWMGAAEKLVFDHFQECAPFVSPFSINNPDGWRYWFMHFARSHRARQVYNVILHENSSQQAHFGRSGLRMLAYNPEHETGSLYLFDQTARDAAKEQLMDDIPRLISENGDIITAEDFYLSIYNETPAHKDDIHQSIMDNPDLEVTTANGGERRKAHTIKSEDTIHLKRQRSFIWK